MQCKIWVPNFLKNCWKNNALTRWTKWTWWVIFTTFNLNQKRRGTPQIPLYHSLLFTGFFFIILFQNLDTQTEFHHNIPPNTEPVSHFFIWGPLINVRDLKRFYFLWRKSCHTSQYICKRVWLAVVISLVLYHDRSHYWFSISYISIKGMLSSITLSYCW